MGGDGEGAKLAVQAQGEAKICNSLKSCCLVEQSQTHTHTHTYRPRFLT